MSKDDVAQALCDANSIRTGLFTYASGKQGPVYVDIRVLPSTPSSMDAITDAMADKVNKLNPDVIAGAETAGIPLAAVISIKTGIPMVYVRKKPKTYGTQSQVEGVFKKGAKAVLIDDMITNGWSKVDFIEGLRFKGLVVEDCLVVVDREQGGTETLEKNKVQLHSLISLKEMLEYMFDKKLISDKDYNSVLEYLEDSEGWQRKISQRPSV
ncbi:MAG: orotate phosphoribosyltransferase [Candidatus Altiarchaeales archaeon]|nr:orotate phosphoribosyltransferase [Candidatus Altiarchaeales archaeon]